MTSQHPSQPPGHLPGQLTELFETTAGAADVPRLPLDEVLARGHRLQQVRRRRTAIWTAAAAAVAVVAVSLPLAFAGHGSDDSPAPVHHLPPATSSSAVAAKGVPTRPAQLPYLAGHVLHLRGKEIPTQATNLLSHGDTTLMWSSKTGQWWQLRDGRIEQLGPPPPTGDQPWTGWHDITLSPNGHALVVLTHPTQNSSRVTAYDATTDKELGHVDLPLPFSNWTGGGDSVGVAGVNDVGQVFWYQEDDPKGVTWWMWQPKSSPVQVHLQLDVSGASYPPSGAVADNGDVVTFSNTGKATHVATIPDVENANPLWSPSGAFVATGSFSTDPRVTPLGGGAPVSPHVPGEFRTWLGFESDSYLLGVASAADGTTTLIRCASESGACASIQTLPKSWNNWYWATTPPGTPSSPAIVAAADPVAALPQGAPADIATITNGQLSHDGARVTTGVRGAFEAAATILVVHGHADKSQTIAAIDPAGKETPLPALDSGPAMDKVQPALSPDGRYAVGVRLDGSGATLVEVSLTDHAVTGSLTVPGGSQETLRLEGVDDDGRVYATTLAPRSGFTWKPGNARKPLTGAATELVDGLAVVGPHGAVHPSGCDGTYVGVSPSGTQVLCGIAGLGGIGVVSTTTHRVEALDLPAALADSAQGIGFESERAVLVTVDDGSTWLLRCRTTDGNCERIGPVAPGTTYPRLP